MTGRRGRGGNDATLWDLERDRALINECPSLSTATHLTLMWCLRSEAARHPGRFGRRYLHVSLTVLISVVPTVHQSLLLIKLITMLAALSTSLRKTLAILQDQEPTYICLHRHHTDKRNLHCLVLRFRSRRTVTRGTCSRKRWSQCELTTSLMRLH